MWYYRCCNTGWSSNDQALWLGQYFEAIKDDDDGDDDYSGKVKTPKKTPKKSKAATPKRGKGGKVEKRGRPAAKAESPAKKTPAKKSKSPAKKAKTPKKETPKKAPVKKEPPKPGIKNEKIIVYSQERFHVSGISYGQGYLQAINCLV